MDSTPDARPPGHQPDARPPGHQLQDPLWRRGRGDGVGRDHSRRDSSLRSALRILGHVTLVRAAGPEV